MCKGIGECRAITLTVGADTVTGTSGNDTINALTVNASTGADATTLGAFDTIDGGAGNDTLNIYTDTPAATALNKVQQGTIKNVETINIFNAVAASSHQNTAGDLDASKFEGATQVWQNTNAVDVVELAATTTAGFKGIEATAAAALTVTAADAATSATVALNGVKGDAATGAGTVENQAVLAVAGAALETVNVSGTLAQETTTAGANAASLKLDVTAGDDTATLVVNSAVATTLTVTDGANVNVSTVNAAGSAGAITYDAANTVANITTGAAADDVKLNTVFTSTLKAATLTTGEGNDTLSVLVDNDTNDIVGATVTVSAGAGDDDITVDTTPSATTGTLKVSVDAGAGNDTVTLTDGFNSVATTDVIDGGEGTDTVVGAGQTTARVADDYITLTKVIKNFEGLNLTSAEGAVAIDNSGGTGTAEIALDASKLANYKTFTFDALGVISKVAADQALVAKDDLTATATGYISTDTGAATAVNSTTYAGTLNVSALTDGKTITAHADAINLNVTAANTDAVGAQTNVGSTLAGDVKSAVVTLTNGQDIAANGTVSHDNIASISVTADSDSVSTLKGQEGAATELGAMTSLTLKGNGAATVINTKGALATVDASQLGGTYTVTADGNTKGAATLGLDYTSTNANAETIKLGSGIDALNLGASTYGKMDVVEGLNLVLNDAGDALAASSDTITTGSAVFKAFTTTQTDLDLALLDAAQSATDNNLVFNIASGADAGTYIFVDAGTANQIDAADTVIKLTGTVDLDTLIIALA